MVAPPRLWGAFARGGRHSQRRVPGRGQADDEGPGTLLGAGTRHQWPMATTTTGEIVDLGRVPGPDERRAVLAYLLDFSSGYFRHNQPPTKPGVGLRWPLEVFDKAWLWQEVYSTPGWPWFGRAYAVAVEPASAIPGHGMAEVRASGRSGFRSRRQASRQVMIEAVLFEGTASRVRDRRRRRGVLRRAINTRWVRSLTAAEQPGAGYSSG